MSILPQIRNAFAGRAPSAAVAVEALLLALLALQCARLLWLALAPAGPIGTPAHETAPVASVPSPAAFGDLFFRSVEGAGAATSAAGYLLFGVRVDGDAGSAILGKDGRQRAYAVGDTIAPGLRLVEVAADHVLLRDSGGDARLAMVRKSTTPGTAAPHALPASLPSAARQAGADATAAAGVAPAQLLSRVGLRPGDDGGYTLLPKGDDALMRQAGLQPGDVLLAVDGQRLDAEGLAELRRDLPGRAQATLTVRRDGQTRTVTVGDTR